MTDPIVQNEKLNAVNLAIGALDEAIRVLEGNSEVEPWLTAQYATEALDSLTWLRDQLEEEAK